jgi:redox-sensitive bicupin YhaK (pirin superfamily)
MMKIRHSKERGYTQLGWLNSHHTFSFGEYYDPKHMGVSNLRVINDDTVAPGGGFGTHGHRDMEIISYVLDGALEHRDSLGNGSVIRPGNVQRMSAGTGVRHSEFNHSQEEPVHFLQIWLQPNEMGVAPSYAERHFTAEARRGRLVLLVSPDGKDGSLSAHQDGLMYAVAFRKPVAQAPGCRNPAETAAKDQNICHGNSTIIIIQLVAEKPGKNGCIRGRSPRMHPFFPFLQPGAESLSICDRPL